MNKTTYIFLFRNKQNMILQYKKNECNCRQDTRHDFPIIK